MWTNLQRIVDWASCSLFLTLIPVNSGGCCRLPAPTCRSLAIALQRYRDADTLPASLVFAVWRLFFTPLSRLLVWVLIRSACGVPTCGFQSIILFAADILKACLLVVIHDFVFNCSGDALIQLLGPVCWVKVVERSWSGCRQGGAFCGLGKSGSWQIVVEAKTHSMRSKRSHLLTIAVEPQCAILATVNA